MNTYDENVKQPKDIFCENINNIDNLTLDLPANVKIEKIFENVSLEDELLSLKNLETCRTNFNKEDGKNLMINLKYLHTDNKETISYTSLHKKIIVSKRVSMWTKMIHFLSKKRLKFKK